MKKLFIRNYKTIYGVSAWVARKAWKACEDGTRKAIIAFFD